MLLHIGSETLIDIAKIILIFDYDSFEDSNINNNSIKNFDKIDLCLPNNLPKSIILIQENEKYIVYYSPIKSITLKKRIFR